jgi:hypothetical protein
MSTQLPLFTTAPSSSLIGTKIKLERADSCCNNVAVIALSKATHAASLRCATCCASRGWLSAEAADFITATRARFGAPETIILRSVSSRTSPGAGGESQ